MNKFSSAMLLLCVTAFSSCDKTEQEMLAPELERSNNVHLMGNTAKVVANNFADAQLIQVNYHDNATNQVEVFEKFVYDSEGKLYKAVTHAGGDHAVLSEQIYKYDDKGLLTSTITSYFSEGKVEYTSYNKYEYTADKLLKKKTVYEGTASDNAAGIVKSFTTYETLPNGNYSQEQQFVVDDKGQAVLFSTTQYAYNSSKNPFLKAVEPGTANGSSNKVASSTLVHGNKNSYKNTYSYKYDKNGYPVSQTVTKPNGNRETHTFVYSK